MAANSIKIGPVETLLQNVVYALPARQVRVMSSLAVDVSLDAAAWANLANALTGADCTAAFIRCTGGNALIVARV